MVPHSEKTPPRGHPARSRSGIQGRVPSSLFSGGVTHGPDRLLMPGEHGRKERREVTAPLSCTVYKVHCEHVVLGIKAVSPPKCPNIGAARCRHGVEPVITVLNRIGTGDDPLSRWPFQCSISVLRWALAETPTAHVLLAAVAATLRSTPGDTAATNLHVPRKKSPLKSACDPIGGYGCGRRGSVPMFHQATRGVPSNAHTLFAESATTPLS